MAIKDKDGNVYKLRGPNPLVKEMREWDKSAVKLINLGSRSEIVIDKRNPVRESMANVVNIGNELNLTPNESHVVSGRDFVNELIETPSEPAEIPQPIEPVRAPEPKTQPPVIEPVVAQPTTNPQLEKIFQTKGVEYYCAPVIGYKKFDDQLYGSSYTVPRFGTSFVFDAIVVDYSDLELQFWSIREITKDSIVYRKDPQGGERWWKVNVITNKTGGYLCTCSVSDLNPDFS